MLLFAFRQLRMAFEFEEPSSIGIGQDGPQDRLAWIGVLGPDQFDVIARGLVDRDLLGRLVKLCLRHRLELNLTAPAIDVR